jgi:hypothetical protein
VLADSELPAENKVLADSELPAENKVLADSELPAENKVLADRKRRLGCCGLFMVNPSFITARMLVVRFRACRRNASSRN